MLKNLSLRYEPIQDRLVLKLCVTGPGGQDAHHVLLLTRRVCAGWRQDLQAMVDHSAELPQRLDPAARAAVSQAHHQAVSSQVPQRIEPATPTDEATQEGVLVTRIVCGRRRSDGKWVIRFERQAQPELGLLLSSQTLHALVDAVARRVRTAQWDLPELPHERQQARVAQRPESGLH